VRRSVEVSGEAYTVVAFLIGALVTPLLHGIGYIARRQHLKEDRSRAERKEALILLQETLLKLLHAESALEATRPDDDTQRAEIFGQIAAARREVRLRAARVGDEQLWKMVNTPPRKETRVVIDMGAASGPGDPGVEPDRYDQWNARIRELFSEL
jgi:hypothetical protein